MIASSLLLWYTALGAFIIAARLGGWWQDSRGSWKAVFSTLAILSLILIGSVFGMWGIMLTQ